MSSRVNSQKRQTGRKFGNIFLSWKIHSYSMTSAKPNCRIFSPILYARGPHTTTWQLILLPYLEVNAKRHFVFELHRLDNESVVWTDWKIALMTIEESLLCAKRAQTFFKGKSIYKSTVSVAAANIVERLERLQSDTLLLYFQLIVSDREANNSIEGTSDVGLKCLSRDLFALYKRGRHSDLVIRTRDKSIPAHKAILHCRSPYFKSMFEKHRHKDVFDIKEFSYKTVDNMLSYLYSGKLEFVLGRPSIAMYECAVRFQTKEVNRYYGMDHFPLESKIDVEEIFDVWNIKNFRTRSEDCIESEIFTKATLNVTVRFSLYTKGKDSRSNFVSIFAEFDCDDGKKQMICMELGIIDCNKKITYVSKGIGVAEGTIILEFCDWPYGVINSNVLVDGTLSIAVKLQVADTETSWKTFGTPSLYNFFSPNDREHSYSRLSKDISSLLTSGLYSDAIFVSDSVDFEVHKCILAARSRTFNKQIIEWRPVYLSCRNLSIKSHILSILMDYLYSGILRKFNLSDVSEVYDAADEYVLPTLKVIISQILRKSLTVENVSDSLIFADRKEDTELKHSALKFICLNSPAVFAQKNFQQLITSRIFLYTEVNEFARNHHCAFTSSKTSQISPKFENV